MMYKLLAAINRKVYCTTDAYNCTTDTYTLFVHFKVEIDQLLLAFYRLIKVDSLAEKIDNLHCNHYGLYLAVTRHCAI